MTYVALLRGINVGGKNPLPMKELVALFSTAGGSEARSYIASGNIIFGAASAKLAAKVVDTVERRIRERFGFEIPLVLRTSDELALVAKSNPFVQPDADFSKLMVMFLADKPSAPKIAALDPDRSPPDEAVVRGREIYLRCPNGFGRSKLTNSYFDSKLGTVSTGRNWRTVLKLLELTS